MCYVDLGADESNELGCQGSDYNQKSNDRSSYDQGLTSECSDSDMSNIRELTSGTESSRSENLRNTDSDSGTSEIQWGNPLNGRKSVKEMQLVVGLSVEDEDWVVPFGERSTSSNELKGTLDEGLGLAMNPDIQTDQD